MYKSIALTELDSTETYKLAITAVVPRPIGWLSTQSVEGLTNAAPFSWFNAVCGDPLMFMTAIGRRRGEIKDTLRNIQAMGEYVVNVATADNAPSMVQSSADYAADESEFDQVGLTAIASTHIKPPRIAESPIHFECVVEQILPLGNESTDLVIGRCVAMHIEEGVLGLDGRVDALKLKPIARLGRDEYAVIEQLIKYPRPKPT